MVQAAPRVSTLQFPTCRIKTTSSGSVLPLTLRPFAPLLPQSLITATSFGRISHQNELLTARGFSTSALLGGSLQFQTHLSGRLSATSYASLVRSEALFTGVITSTSFVYLPPLPLLPALAPPVCEIDVTLDDYLNLITSEHIDKPNFLQTVTVSVEPYLDDQILVNSLPCLFDVDVSVGEQEDFTGQWIGKTRYVSLGDVFFSWDVHGLGWDESNWRGPFDPPNVLERLDDYHYRLLLYATIVANHWDGSIPSAYIAWDTLFEHTGYEVIIQDFGNMTMMMALKGAGHIDAVTQALFSNGSMDLRPEGVALIDYVFQATPGVPFFAFDAHSDAGAGWDIGYWGYLVPPGQGFIPQ